MESQCLNSHTMAPIQSVLHMKYWYSVLQIVGLFTKGNNHNTNSCNTVGI